MNFTSNQLLGRLWQKVRKPILPQEFAPWGSYPQDFLDLTNVPFTTTPGTTAWVDVRSFKVEAQKRAMVAYFAMTSNNDTADIFIRFRFLVNGNVLTNYQAPPVNFGIVAQPSRIWIQLEQENILTLQLGSMDDTITYAVSTRLTLWTWDLFQHPTRGD